MRYLEVTISEAEFKEFLTELRRIYFEYASDLMDKQVFQVLDVLIQQQAEICKITYDRLNINLLGVSIYINNTLANNYTTSISNEILTASIFSGTSLFDKLNKSPILEIDFLKKNKTEICLSKSLIGWDIEINIE